MEIREVEKKIKACLGGTFSGKVAVRIIAGKIVACDVGETGKGMPYPTREELMQRVVNAPAPVTPPPEVTAARVAVDAARRAFDDAHNAFVRARDEVAEQVRRGYVMHHRGATTDNRFDQSGEPLTDDITAAKRALREAEAAVHSRETELASARTREHEADRRWERARREQVA